MLSMVNCEPDQEFGPIWSQACPQASDYNIISPSRRSLSSVGHEKTNHSRSVTSMEQEVSSNKAVHFKARET